jgi:hypothetical protein
MAVALASRRGHHRLARFIRPYAKNAAERAGSPSRSERCQERCAMCLLRSRLPPSTDRALLAKSNARAERISLIIQGRYSAWFKTPIGEGAGVVEFHPDGRLSGRDTTFSYDGNWTQEGERFKTTLFAKRTAPGPPDVFGMHEIEIVSNRRL